MTETTHEKKHILVTNNYTSFCHVRKTCHGAWAVFSLSATTGDLSDIRTSEQFKQKHNVGDSGRQKLKLPEIELCSWGKQPVSMLLYRT
jgi:hypothetical protein